MEPPRTRSSYGLAKFTETNQRGKGYRLRAMVASGVVGLASEARSTASPYVDAHPVPAAHRLSEVVEKTVRAELADAQATVHVEPTAIPDESPAELRAGGAGSFY